MSHYIKRARKGFKNCSFNLIVRTRLHIDKNALTSPADKTVEMQYFESAIILLSKTHK